MAKKGEMKPMDQHEQKIRDNAVRYNVVFFQPATSSRVSMTFDTLEEAKLYSTEKLQEKNMIRSAMIYAANEYENHAMVGSIDRKLKWKEVIPATYK
jgi:viroplasmin and RNaseH domain-containing protein